MAQKNPSPDSNLTPRFHRPSLKDPKLFIGLLLITVSMMAVVGIVRASNHTETYYVAARDIQIGDHLDEDDLHAVEVQLGDSQNLYLNSADNLDKPGVAIDNIRAGEFVSKNDLAVENTGGGREITVVLDTAVTSSFSSGDRVDIWASQQSDTGPGFDDPQIIGTAAEISSITAEESLIGRTGKSAVHLLVAEADLAQVIAAVNREDKITVIPTSYTANQGDS